jgi:hypothetical protein
MKIDEVAVAVPTGRIGIAALDPLRGSRPFLAVDQRTEMRA